MNIDSVAEEFIKVNPFTHLLLWSVFLFVPGVVALYILRRTNNRKGARRLDIGLKIFASVIGIVLLLTLLSYGILNRAREANFLLIAGQDNVGLTVHVGAEDFKWDPPISTEFLQIIAEAPKVKAHHSHSLPLLSFDVSDLSLGKTHWYRVGRDSEHENEFWLDEITEDREFGQPMHQFQSKELTSFLEVRGILEPSRNDDEG